MTLRRSTPKLTRRLVGTVALTAGLFTGAAGLAGAATGVNHVAKSQSKASHSVASRHQADTPENRRPDLGQPHLGGQVVAVTSSEITVADHDGFWRTIVTSDATTYVSGTTAATRDAVVVGQFVEAQGTVDANHTSLDASTVNVSSAPPAAPPAAPGDSPRSADMHR